MIDCRRGSLRDRVEEGSWCYRIEEGVGVIDYRRGSWCDRVYRRELS